MSPRAAWRLESLGFDQVYDYVPGKAAWLASGLPAEGEVGSEARAGSIARRDVPTCGVAEPVGAVRDRAGGWPVVVVVADGTDHSAGDGPRAVLGLLRTEALGVEPTTPAGEVMQPGPSTFRPSITCRELSSYFADHDVPRALVTTLDGVLVGLVSKDDVDACAQRGRGDG